MTAELIQRISRKHDDYELWAEPPRTRTVLIGDGVPFKADWPWTSFLVRRAGPNKQFNAMYVFATRHKPNGIDDYASLIDTGHNTGNGVCLGDYARFNVVRGTLDPIEAFWNTGFSEMRVGDDYPWENRLWNDKTQMSDYLFSEDYVARNEMLRPVPLSTWRFSPSFGIAMLALLIALIPMFIIGIKHNPIVFGPLLVVTWLVYAAIAIAGMYMDFHAIARRYFSPEHAAERFDWKERTGLAMMLGVTGPVGFFISLLETKFFQHGLMFKRPRADD